MTSYSDYNKTTLTSVHVKRLVALFVIFFTLLYCHPHSGFSSEPMDAQANHPQCDVKNEKGSSIPMTTIPELTDEEINGLISKGNDGDGRAACELYEYYSYDSETCKESRYWLFRAAELGYTYAQYTLGRFFMSGVYACLDIPKDEKTGRYWLKLAADSTSDRVTSAYAKIDLKMKLTTSELEAMSRIAEDGSLVDILLLGRYYYEIEKDDRFLVYWSRRAQDMMINGDFEKRTFENLTSNLRKEGL